MGFIQQFDLGRIIRDYHTRFFVETGTWKGDGVEAALAFPFDKIISAEIVPEIAAAAASRFTDHPQVTIIESSSAAMLEAWLPVLEGNCLFWLDAHFPGADAGLSSYDAENEENLRLPLETELRLIARRQANFTDVLIIDDLRVYEEGPFENGPAPADTLPRQAKRSGFVEELFGATHHILRSYRNEGYWILLPAGATGLPAPDPGDLFRAL